MEFALLAIYANTKVFELKVNQFGNLYYHFDHFSGFFGVFFFFQ